MGTRFIFKTTTGDKGKQVTFRHKSPFMLPKNRKRMTDIVQEARNRLLCTSTVLNDRDNGAYKDYIEQAANTYFLGTPSSDQWDAINSKIVLTYNGLNSDVTLKLGGRTRESVKEGFKKGSLWGEVNCERGSGVDHAIHISKALILGESSNDLGIITVIHEASHKFADTDDEGYRKESDDGWDDPGHPADMDEAIKNADSLAYFVFHVGGNFPIP